MGYVIVCLAYLAVVVTIIASFIKGLIALFCASILLGIVGVLFCPFATVVGFVSFFVSDVAVQIAQTIGLL